MMYMFSVGSDDVCALLERMALPCTASGTELSVEISPMRPDIMHAVDVYEDVAVGYGYNNIKKTFQNIN